MKKIKSNVTAVMFTAIISALLFPILAFSQNQQNSKSGSKHYAKALVALQAENCDEMRAELKKAAESGYELDKALVDDWGYRCGKTLLDWSRDFNVVSAVAASSRESFAAASTMNGVVHIFDLKQSKPIGSWETGHSEITALDLSADGSLIAVGGGNKLIIRDLARNKDIWSGEMDAHISKVRFSEDGKLLAVGMNKLIAPVGKSSKLEGQIICMSLDDMDRAVSMAEVPGNPEDIAFTRDGKKIVAFCWPSYYAFNTYARLCVWDAASGEDAVRKTVRTTSAFPAHLSRDGRVVIYSKLNENVLNKHKIKLGRDGRPMNLANRNSYAWLRNPSNYKTVALDVLTGDEMPIISGASVIGVSNDGKRVLSKNGSDQVKVEEIGSGVVFAVNLLEDPLEATKKVYAAFGPGSSVVLGRTSNNLGQFGWLPSDVSGGQSSLSMK